MTEEEGIAAIIYLQSLAGITETREQAQAGWQAMRLWEREATMDTYTMMKKVAEAQEKS